MTDKSVLQSSQHGYALLERRRQIVTDAAKDDRWLKVGQMMERTIEM